MHDRARLKLSRTGSRSTTSGDHPRGPRRAGDKLILFIHRPTPCTPRGQCQRGHFRRLLQTGIAGSGLLWASQLDPQPAWPGPGRGGHCGGRGGSRDMKTGVSERSRTSCSYHQPKSGFTSNSGVVVLRVLCACVWRANSASRFPEAARRKNSENAGAQVLDSGPQIPAQSPRAKPEFEVQTRIRALTFRRPNFRPERAIIAPHSAFPAAEIPAGISYFA